MDQAESRVRDYLEHIGITDIKYEPDGNVPPDFLIEGQIAVEVRRLNQNTKPINGRFEGLEQDFQRISGRIEKIASRINPRINNESWFLIIEFKRPIEEWKLVKNEIRKKLKNFSESPDRKDDSIISVPSIKIELIRASWVYEKFFVMGGIIDFDSGGWVVSEMKRNIDICMRDKEQKIKGYYHNYPNWWLILIDQISNGLSKHEQNELRHYCNKETVFDKIIIVTSSGSLSGFVL